MGKTNYVLLDEALRRLGSPPKDFHWKDIQQEAAKTDPSIASSSADSIGATLAFRSINVRGRATIPGDFDREDGWNQYPCFLKTRPATYRALSDDGRQCFAKLWKDKHPLLRKPEYDVSEWDDLMKSQDPPVS